jgi:HEAT repeat protein
MAISKDAHIRCNAAEILGIEYRNIIENEDAFQDLYILAHDNDSGVRWAAVEALGSAFQYIPNKNVAANCLLSLINDENDNVRLGAAEALGLIFQYIPNRHLALKYLVKLTDDKNSSIQLGAIDALESAFSFIPDRELAWSCLFELAKDEEIKVQLRAIEALGSVSQFISDKNFASKDLIKLTEIMDIDIRLRAIEALGYVLQNSPENSVIFDYLRRLEFNRDIDISNGAREALGACYPRKDDEFFFEFMDKMEDRFAYKDNYLRSMQREFKATLNKGNLGGSYRKDISWKQLHNLTKDNDSIVRFDAAIALGSVFRYIPNKVIAWQDLHDLSMDEDSSVRWSSVNAIGSAFPFIVDKKLAWEAINRLAQDDDDDVRREVADILGEIYPYIMTKKLVRHELQRMTEDKDEKVRCFAFYALGRASVYDATEAKDDHEFKIKLEDAINFFGNSSKDESIINPAAFCLPFYRSLHCLLFTTTSRESEVERYLTDARKAIQNSKSRETLLEAVDNLSKALDEVKSFNVNDFTVRRYELRGYMRYCFQAVECLDVVRKRAPYASRLVEMGIPIIDENIKALFKDVETSARSLCKNSKGTSLEGFGRSAYEITKGLEYVESPVKAEHYFEEIVPLLKAHCSRLPEETQPYINDLLGSIETSTLEQRFNTLKIILLATLVQGKNDDLRDKERENTILLLKNIEFNIMGLNRHSADNKQILSIIQMDLRKLAVEMDDQCHNRESLGLMESLDESSIDKLESIKEDLVGAFEEIAKDLSSKNDIERILREVENLKQSDIRELLSVSADFYQVFWPLIEIIGLIISRH